MDGTLKWSCGRTVVVQLQGERYQRSLAMRREDTGFVSKLCVKTLFISENFHSKFRSFFCIVTVISCISNHIIILGKQFIYKSRYQEIIPQYNVFKLEIDHTCNVEKYLAVKNNKEESLNFKWSAISNP